MRRFATLMLAFCLSVTSVFATDFTDDDLHSWLADPRPGIIYLWSPLMPLSEMGREDIIQIAQEQGLRLQILRDPYAPYFIGKADPILHSVELMDAGALDHYPAIFVVNHGEVKSGVIQGYEQPQSLTKLILNKLADNEIH